MTIWYEGGGSGQRKPFLRISVRGDIYINAVLSRQARSRLGRTVQLGYDPGPRRLILRQCKPEVPGARCVAESHRETRRISAVLALRQFGLLPRAKPLTAPAVVYRHPETQAWQIVATLPRPATPAPAKPEKPTRHDAEVAAALDVALEYEDELPVEDGEAEAEEALTALPLRKDKRVCEWCTFRRTGRCVNPQSPRANLRVGAADFCALFVRRKATPPSAGERPQRGPRGKRRRVRCAVCGAEQPMSRNGHPYAHDRAGQGYRGGRGDRERPCPGNHQPGEPI